MDTSFHRHNGFIVTLTDTSERGTCLAIVEHPSGNVAYKVRPDQKPELVTPEPWASIQTSEAARLALLWRFDGVNTREELGQILTH